MKIRSIKPTNRLQEVPLSIIKDDLEENPDAIHHVLTPSGWTKVLDFAFMKRGPSKIFSLRADKFSCDPGHVLQIIRDGKLTAARADQIDCTNDVLVGFHCEHLRHGNYYSPGGYYIDDGPEEDFYDITISDPHWYYTSGLVSHNSIVLCNNAITSWQGPGPGGRVGQDVLLVTFELDYIKTSMRCLGVLGEDIPMDKLVSRQDEITSKINSLKTTYDGKIFISELPPEQCSVDHLYHLLDNLRRSHGWHPDVVIIDYLDLMVSRNKYANRDDYSRQKAVANEVRGFAKNENVLVFTATQTNRSAGSTGEAITLKDAAESYAKQFSMDYIITINQTPEERESSPPRFRFFIAKNRNGPKHKTVTCEINYTTMKVREINT